MYLMSYFRTESEALHLAFSSDGLLWEPLNQNRPVWHAPIGNKSVRDPFILRDEQGIYRLFSTNSWHSDSIIVADSTDLIEWTHPRLVTLMSGVKGTRNTWAPECFFDPEAGVYRVIWSSSQDLRSLSEMEKSADWNHRIWTSSTTDFENWTPPEFFFDPGYSVIDACVVHLRLGRWMMSWKDERSTDATRLHSKKIKVSFAPSISGPWTEESAFLTNDMSEGPTLFPRTGGWTLLFDAFTAHYFGALHSDDEGQTWRDISSQVTFPPGPRHASVIEIPETDANTLLAHWN
ncbi:hypothetical protein IAD21_03093 [Abditibacteriota bacterium]|nr:hypothetical protein IAD21_03093 [Abditibacteriota bacterium]